IVDLSSIRAPSDCDRGSAGGRGGAQAAIGSTPANSTSVAEAARGSELLGRVPVAFVPDLGQWSGAGGYVARIGSMTARLDERGWSLGLCASRPNSAERDPHRWRGASHGAEPAESAPPADALRGATVRMTFLHGKAAELVPEDRLAGV